MKHLITILMLITAGSMLACTKGGDPEGVNGSRYAVSAAASAKQLVPAIDTTFTGSFTGTYDEASNVFTFTITWNDLWKDTKKDTITAIAFYGPAAATANGALVRSLPLVNPNKAGSINLGLAGGTGWSERESTDLLAGGYYFTVNTKRYPQGIIRGQLAVAKQ